MNLNIQVIPQAYQTLIKKNKKITIIGVGGIDSGKSAFEKIAVGADVIQLYTGMVYRGPGIVKEIKKELISILKKDKTYYDGIHIYSKDPFKDKELIEKALPSFGVGVVGWWQQNGNFFAAMEMEKKALFIVLMLIILIASPIFETQR